MSFFSANIHLDFFLSFFRSCQRYLFLQFVGLRRMTRFVGDEMFFSVLPAFSKLLKIKLSDKILHFLIMLEFVAIVCKIISTRFYINGAGTQLFKIRYFSLASNLLMSAGTASSSLISRLHSRRLLMSQF